LWERKITGEDPLNNFIERTKNMSKKVKTGDFVPVSGRYRPTGKDTEVTFAASKRVLTTSDDTRIFTMVDKTKHLGGIK